MTEQSQNLPPPLPPSAPASLPPLPYAGPMPPPVVPGKPTFFQQAARASWVAPLIAFILGFLTLSSRLSQTPATSSSSSALIIGISVFGRYLTADEKAANAARAAGRSGQK